MLGYHTVVGMTQIASQLIDSSLLVGYQNSKQRLNWGAVAQRIPYVYGQYSTGIGEVLREPAYIEELLLYRQINYQVAGFATYPFSQVQRFELFGGFQLIDFDLERRIRAFSLIDGYKLIDDKEKLPSPESLSFGFASAALVYDSSLFGATGPIIGQSYRFEVAPYVGTIDFYTILADYRRYFMPLRPFTLAFRFLHYGRYGKGGEDSRLYPIYIGYESLVRGYNSGSFDYDEIDFDYASLFGSKIFVANAELRFPLFNVLGLGRGYYGILPIDFIAFFDTGVAWWDEFKPDFLGGSRHLVSSTGVGLRMNVFGYLVIGVNYVKPLNRARKGWYFQFSFFPGF